MHWLVQAFRDNPVIPIFLTIGIGFFLGRLKYKSFSLGVVAATLLTGVIVGQLDIPIPGIVKSIFFILFLFSIGYSVGPQFFKALKGQGLKQVLFSVVEALICAFNVVGAAELMGYDTGEALGLFAGSQTASASLGVVSETVKGLDMADSDKNSITSMMTVCYAVTYIFGTIGSAWFLSNIGPRLLGGLKKVKEETRMIESEMESGSGNVDPGAIDAGSKVMYRAYTAECSYFDRPRSVKEVEKAYKLRNLRIFIARVRINGVIYEKTTELKIKHGDVIVLSGRSDVLLEEGKLLGQEVMDHELLDFKSENLPVTVSSKGVSGMTFGKLRCQPYMHGVIVRSLLRNNIEIPAFDSTVLETGDVLVLVGLSSEVNNAASEIGFADRNTNTTDMVTLGLGIAIGCLVGVFSFRVGGIPISLSTTGGALFSGLILGWWRNRHPTFGKIPPAVVGFLDNIGLNMFIAVVGITAGPGFLAGLKSVGPLLFLVGVICTFIPLTICILLGRKVFRFSSPETLGCVAGSRCGVASIGAIQDTLESTVPMIGYAVTYATANFILVFSSLIVLFLV